MSTVTPARTGSNPINPETGESTNIKTDVAVIEFLQFEKMRRVKMELNGYQRFKCHLRSITNESKDMVKVQNRGDIERLTRKRITLICLLSEGLQKCDAIKSQAKAIKEQSFRHQKRWEAMITWIEDVERTINIWFGHHERIRDLETTRDQNRFEKEFLAAGGENCTSETQTIGSTNGRATESTFDDSQWGHVTRERKKIPREGLIRRGKKQIFAYFRGRQFLPSERDNASSE
jgi:hypothetical protein